AAPARGRTGKARRALRRAGRGRAPGSRQASRRPRARRDGVIAGRQLVADGFDRLALPIGDRLRRRRGDFAWTWERWLRRGRNPIVVVHAVIGDEEPQRIEQPVALVELQLRIVDELHGRDLAVHDLAASFELVEETALEPHGGAAGRPSLCSPDERDAEDADSDGELVAVLVVRAP